MLIYMDNHPIPQDVTGFQFKLIGNMTVKQFAYLATGTVLAIVFFQLPVNALIKFPLSLLFALIGIGLAYVPVGGRPMDSMIGYYIKALIRPTIFVYDRATTQPYDPNKAPTPATIGLSQLTGDLSLTPRDKLKTYLETRDVKPKNKLDKKEDDFILYVSGLAAKTITIHPNSPPAPSPILQQVSVHANPQPIITTPVATFKQAPAAPTTPVAPAFKPIAQPLSRPEPPRPAPAPQAQQPILIKPSPRSYSKTVSVASAFTFPNLITGLTRDARGNALPNILVEIKDKDNNPVRAFKTNEFGRFASATSLANGTYSVEFEDPKAQNRFEKMTINATGGIMPSIQATSIDMREELRRSLFEPSN